LLSNDWRGVLLFKNGEPNHCVLNLW